MAEDAEGEGAVAAALKGDGLVGNGPPGPVSMIGPPALLTGVTLVRLMLLTPLLLWETTNTSSTNLHR